jgi:hypothetical protein
MVMQFAQLLLNPAIAGAMGKLIRIGDQRAIQTNEGTVNLVVANKFLVTVEGSAGADAKLAYAQGSTMPSFLRCNAGYRGCHIAGTSS